ncbi:MAG: hypothetical protein BV459_07120 [Thermoplasmata archaeon M11B2D]|nr:MAG: hypothetical protein BV459_07120 [Thermoplasmata archaeon M11B2D]PNX50412.1 MAG: hypothetical protein BV458_13255 [Thermoplasmata archaeon M9B2D]
MYQIVDQIDFSYIAGAIDCDGTIGIYKKNTGYLSCRVSIASVHLHFLQKLQKFFNGTIVSKKTCKPGHRLGYDLQWNKKDDVLNLLKNIEPFLLIKKKQAQIVISFLENYTQLYGGNGVDESIKEKERERREELRSEIRILNKQGV